MSDYFQWDAAKLGLKIPEMDEEHKVLIGYMNSLHDLHERKAHPSDQLHALDQLASYTAKHFADEEAYMEKVGFPGLRIHRAVHRQLLERLEGFRADARRNRALPEDIFVFFKMWLSAHICGVDTKYAQHALARRAG